MSEQEKIVELYRKSKQNLVEFYRIFLSDDDQYCKAADFHYKISRILLEDHRHFAVEMFRESAKSTYVLKTFPLYRLTFPKKDEQYIVIIKNNQTLADAKLKEIKDDYLSHPIISQNLVSVHQSSASVFEVSLRNISGETIRMRIEAYGKGASIRGLSWGNLRPQVIIADDLQDLEDAESETVTEKDWNWFLADVNFLAKKGRIFIIGNNLGERCIIERIINSNLAYEVLKIPAIVDNKSSWPEAFSMDYLNKEREEFTKLGKIDIWMRERMCVAIPDELRVFKPENFKHFEEVDIMPKSLEFYVTVDLAISQKQSADDSVICVVGKEPHKPEWYIVEFIAGRLSPLEVIDGLFKVYDKYRPSRVGIEAVAYQKALFYFLEEEQRKRQTYFNMVEIRSTQKKEQRIRGLQPLFKAGVIFHRANMIKFEEQLLSFPKGLHDDYIDALAMQLELVQHTTSKRRVSKPQGYIDIMR